jgi:hypothetical protein
VEGTLVNVLTDAVSFFGEDSIDSGYAIGCEICCGHNIKKLVVERGLIDRVPYFQLITLELFVAQSGPINLPFSGWFGWVHRPLYYESL